MNVYKFTKFTQQVSRSMALQGYRNAINARLSALRTAANFAGYQAVGSVGGRTAILAAAGSSLSPATHVYEIPIGGHWRIFAAPSTGGGAMALMIGHLDGNDLEEP